MIKIAYSITKLKENENIRLTGIGYKNNNDIILKNDKTIKNILRNCQPIQYKEKEYSGRYENDETQKSKQISYKIWFKILDNKTNEKETINKEKQENKGEIDDEIFG